MYSVEKEEPEEAAMATEPTRPALEFYTIF